MHIKWTHLKCLSFFWILHFNTNPKDIYFIAIAVKILLNWKMNEHHDKQHCDDFSRELLGSIHVQKPSNLIYETLLSSDWRVFTGFAS